MKEGHKLFVTVNYAFDYNDSKFSHLGVFDILIQFFEHRNGLKGYVSDEKGDRIEEGSDVAILSDRLFKAFDNKDVPKTVKELLHEYEMYEILGEYVSPLEGEALKYREELISQ